MAIRCCACKTKSRSSARYCRRCGEPLEHRDVEEFTVVENQTLTCAGGLVLRIQDPTVPRRGEPYVTLFSSAGVATPCRELMTLGRKIDVSVPGVGSWRVELVEVEPEFRLAIFAVCKIRREAVEEQKAHRVRADLN